MSSFATFNALFSQPSDPFDPDHLEYECRYERGMRRAEAKLLECSYRYAPGAAADGGDAPGDDQLQDQHEQQQARDTGAHAVLEQFDTAIPRSVLPRGSNPPKVNAEEEGLGRVRSLKRMGSSLITSCVAPSVSCLDGVDDMDEGMLLEGGDGKGEDGRDSAMDNSLVESASRNSLTAAESQNDEINAVRPPSTASNSLTSSTSTARANKSVHTKPDDETLHMHAIRVTLPHPHRRQQHENQQEQQQHQESPSPETSSSIEDQESQSQSAQPPLVLLHGYANGSLYFYRNLHGLSKHFATIYAVDMMGWGLSSRPSFPTYEYDTKESDEHKKQSVREAEGFFVQSLEAWRRANGIESMILGGHSLGGYVAVAYTERYSERVAKLLLLSPVGVPGEPKKSSTSSSPTKNPKNSELPQSPTESNVPIVAKVAKRMAKSLFDSGWTPGAVIRTVGQTQGVMAVESYVDKRLPGVQCPQERTALIEYLYNNAVLPPSGEECLNRLLLPGAHAVYPLCERVPHLKVSEVVFLYGEKDWMDPTAGMDVERYCRQQRAEGNLAVPNVSVRAVRNAGHLLMIENWEGFNAAVIWACGGVLDPNVARMHRPASFMDNRRKNNPYSRFLAAAGSETTEESYGSQEGVELDLTGQYIIEEEEDYIEYGKEATFTEKCTGVSIRKPNFAR